MYSFSKCILWSYNKVNKHILSLLHYDRGVLRYRFVFRESSLHNRTAFYSVLLRKFQQIEDNCSEIINIKCAHNYYLTSKFVKFLHFV